MKKLIFTCLSVVVLALSSCDPADQYPISFKVNGSPWYANAAPTYLVSGKILINATSITQGQNPIAFSLTQYAMVDTFELDSANNAFLFGASLGSGYYAKAHHPATIIIKEFNPSDKHIVAEFYGHIFNSSSNDSVLITDGKFDLHYQE